MEQRWFRLGAQRLGEEVVPAWGMSGEIIRLLGRWLALGSGRNWFRPRADVVGWCRLGTLGQKWSWEWFASESLSLTSLTLVVRLNLRENSWTPLEPRVARMGTQKLTSGSIVSREHYLMSPDC